MYLTTQTIQLDAKVMEEMEATGEETKTKVQALVVFVQAQLAEQVDK